MKIYCELTYDRPCSTLLLLHVTFRTPRIMNLTILFLFAGHVFMASALSYNECEPREYGRCLWIFTDVFRNAEKNQSLVDLYCKAHKDFSECLTSNAECVGNMVDLLRFELLQHMILDNRLGICTHTDLTPLKKLVHANEKYRLKIAGFKELDADHFAPCTAKKNVYCASRFAEDLREGAKMCPVLSKFFECYKSMTKCTDKIYKDYVANIKGGKETIKFAKLFPNVIPC